MHWEPDFRRLASPSHDLTNAGGSKWPLSFAGEDVRRTRVISFEPPQGSSWKNEVSLYYDPVEGWDGTCTCPVEFECAKVRKIRPFSCWLPRGFCEHLFLPVSSVVIHVLTAPIDRQPVARIDAGLPKAGNCHLLPYEFRNAHQQKHKPVASHHRPPARHPFPAPQSHFEGW